MYLTVQSKKLADPQPNPNINHQNWKQSMQGTTSEPIAHSAPEHSAAIVSHHDSIKWFEAIPGEQLCIRVHGTQVNGRYAIMENIAAPGTATPMHFHAEDEIFHILEGTVTFSIDGDVFNASVGSIVVIPAGAHHAWRNRSNSPIRM